MATSLCPQLIGPILCTIDKQPATVLQGLAMEQTWTYMRPRAASYGRSLLCRSVEQILHAVQGLALVQTWCPMRPLSARAWSRRPWLRSTALPGWQASLPSSCKRKRWCSPTSAPATRLIRCDGLTMLHTCSGEVPCVCLAWDGRQLHAEGAGPDTSAHPFSAQRSVNQAHRAVCAALREQKANSNCTQSMAFGAVESGVRIQVAF